MSYNLSSSGYGYVSSPVATLPPEPPKKSSFVERAMGEQSDIDRAINWIQEHILSLFPVYCWVAGGSIKEVLKHSSSYDCTQSILTDVNDFDVYFSSERDFEMAKSTVLANNGILIRQTPFSEKYEINGIFVDLVSVPHENPEACVASFDFTVCCAAIDGQKLVHHRDYFLHNTTKKIGRASCRERVEI